MIIWFADEVFAVKGEQKQSVAKVLLTSRVLACRGGVIVGVVLIKVCVALICGRCSPARETINTPTRRRSVCLRQCGEVVLPSGRLRVCVSPAETQPTTLMATAGDAEYRAHTPARQYIIHFITAAEIA